MRRLFERLGRDNRYPSIMLGGAFVMSGLAFVMNGLTAMLNAFRLGGSMDAAQAMAIGGALVCGVGGFVIGRLYSTKE